MKLLLVMSALSATISLAAGGCEDAPRAAKGDQAGIVMGRRGDTELMVGPRDGSPAFVRKATRAQIKACTRRPSMAYPDCLP
ncbi:hypothetical protein FHU36_000278 [Nonomuraea muscovyensis]|uniref:Secreted protein n=1 Tax=Nonomuraea muscovyensis TaxID=1124761 RepID=A0A7X0BZB5_9ACTN|nr:hypothetical protein [Nonomuraea muscovyensis]MBB6343769.1 hypothetical protein [Nonomuraea muscovyensis]